MAKISVGRIGAGVASNAAGLGVAYGVSRQGLLELGALLRDASVPAASNTGLKSRPPRN